MSELNKLPIEVAEEMKWMAWNAAWHTANTRAGYKGDAVNDKIKFEQQSENVSKAVTGLVLKLSPSTLENIKWGAWCAAWHTANIRAGYENDAANDLEQFEQNFQSLKDSKEVTSELADNIKNMCMSAAWHTANTRKDYKDDAASDLYNFENFYNKICGEITVVDIKFYIDRRKMLALKPKVLAELELKNKSGSEQSMSFECECTEGQTSSWSHTVGFRAGIKTSAKASFKFIVEAEVSIELSFEASYEYAWSGSTEKSETHRYTFPVNVAPHSKVTAKAIVQEAKMTVPYDLVYEIGGVERTIPGIWDGVAYSYVQSEIGESVPLS